MRHLGFAMALTLFTTAAMAADPEDLTLPEEGVIYEKVTEHIFDGVDVNAGVIGPGGAIFIEPKRLEFSPAFRMREHFAVEMRKSIDHVK